MEILADYVKNPLSKEIYKLITIGLKYKNYKSYREPEFEDLTDDYIEKIINNEDAIRYIVNSFAPLFCKLHNFPINSFISLEDYNETKMFYCKAIFPLAKELKVLNNYNEDIYLTDLKLFLVNLIPNKKEDIKEIKLTICEKYIKE